MSVAVYEDSLRGNAAVFVRYRDGRTLPLDVERWQGPARGADESMLRRITGSALDIGCGPGRLVAALAARGVTALGIDIAPVAVGLTRRAGGQALQLSVFDDVPRAGHWDVAVLADGNIGIGGDPLRLLRRAAELLSPTGRVLVELDPPRSGTRSEQVRLEDADGNAGAWFPWAHVPADAISPLAAMAGWRVSEQWSAPDQPTPVSRWFAALDRA
ncbi:MAG: class I SAM-dependent methyltransferase [Mycobacteriales bacterium]